MLVFSINRHKKSGIYRRFTSRLSIYCVRRLIPVAFATLTAPNQKPGTDHDEIISSAGEHLVGGDGVVGTYQFIQRIGYATNTHIAALVGYETTRNTHSHLILHIPDDETERFLARLDRVDMKCLYGGDRHSHFQLWDGDKGDAYSLAKLDRLSRDPLTQMTAERVLAKSGARIISVAGEGTEGEDPAQVLLRRIMGAVAEAEASFTGARVREALRAKKERGERLGRPPFGFQRRPGAPGLIPDKRFPEALRVMELRDQGHTYKFIGDQMGFTLNKVFRIVSRWGDAQSLLERAQHYE